MLVLVASWKFRSQDGLETDRTLNREHRTQGPFETAGRRRLKIVLVCRASAHDA